MLKPQKKVSKKEIKEDKLVTSYFEVQKWVEENTRTISYIAVGIVAVVAIIFIWFKRQADDNEKATTQLAKIVSYYESGKYELAINGVPQEGAQGLQVIVDEYGGTHAGEIAKLYLANSYYALGNYDKAIDVYRDISINDKTITATAYAGIAACYEIKSDHEKAGLYYEKAASKNMTIMQAPENLQKAAWNYAQTGKKDKAIELLQTLKKEFPSSQYGRDVDKYIAEYSS